MSDESVDQMLVLAERLRAANGGELDESAIQAVAEATGAPLEYVRLAVKLRSDKQKKSFLAQLRSQFLTLDPDTRRYVVAGVFSTGAALLHNLERLFDERTGSGSSYGVFGMLALAVAIVGLYSVAISRERRTAAIAGAVFGGGFFLMRSVFAFMMGIFLRVDSVMLIPMCAGGAVLGLALNRLVERNRERLGLKDPARERQELLRQLHDLRDKLHSGEQSLAFLSVDIVGSTRMKQQADPLAVEFTFNEYHQFVERIVRKRAGRVHSTAGDGVICAFPSPQEAFAAAKNIQTGIFELNTLRNKIGVPIVVRCGVHSGSVLAPDAADPTSVEFTEVIDIASHLQRVAPPGGIAVSEFAAMSLPGGAAAVGSQTVQVSDVSAVVWVPKNTVPPRPATPPALPEQA